MVQLTGGMLTKAFALHFAGTLPKGHTINLVDQYEDDVTRDVIPIDGGSSPVPDGPGLGVEVDEEALGFEEGTLRGVDSEIWEDDGTEEFRRVRERVAQEDYWFAPAGEEGPRAG